MGSDTTPIIISLVIIAALELNAIFGKQGPMTTIKGVITSGLVLTVILAGLLKFM